MTTEQMQYLQAVFQEGSLSAAARNLGLSQSTMSKSLQSLEKELGVSLFVRIRGRLIPTSQGYAVLDMAQKICSLQEQMSERISALRTETGRSFTTGFPSRWEYPFFSSILSDFRRLCPSCSIRPSEYAGQEVNGMLKDGTLDLALVPGEMEAETGIRSIPLGEMNILLAVPPQKGRKKAAGTFPAVKLHRLPHLPFAMPDGSSALSVSVNRYFQQLGFVPDILFESPSPQCRMEAVRAGLGYTLVLEETARHREGLTLFSLSPPCSMPMSLAFADRSPLSRELKTLIRLFLKYGVGSPSDPQNEVLL